MRIDVDANIYCFQPCHEPFDEHICMELGAACYARSGAMSTAAADASLTPTGAEATARPYFQATLRFTRDTTLPRLSDIT